MISLNGKYKKSLLAIVLLSSCFFTLKAQSAIRNTGEIEVPILQKLDSLLAGCYRGTGIYDEAAFKQVTMIKECQFPNSTTFIPGFKTESLVGFSIRGDSCVRAGVSVVRSDREKKYEIRIRNLSGGCRAGGGWFQGWFTIKKIPSNYKVEFSELKVIGELPSTDEKNIVPNSLTIENSAPTPELLETLSYQMKTCINISFGREQVVIKDEETFNKSIRNPERCGGNNLEKIDFDKYTLLGVKIYTGHCQTPPLKYRTAKYSTKKEYILSISYLAGGICRGVSYHDIWVLVPKIPEDYRVIFETEAVKPVSKKN